MKQLALIAVVLFIAGCSSKANNTEVHKILWTHDGLFTDSYSIYCGPSAGLYTQNTIVEKSLREFPVLNLNLPDGTNYCAMTANNFNSDSSYSNEISFDTLAGDLIMSPPSSPTGLSVT